MLYVMCPPSWLCTKRRGKELRDSLYQKKEKNYNSKVKVKVKVKPSL